MTKQHRVTFTSRLGKIWVARVEDGVFYLGVLTSSQAAASAIAIGMDRDARLALGRMLVESCGVDAPADLANIDALLKAIFTAERPKVNGNDRPADQA